MLQCQKGVGGDGALALALGAGQQVVDGQLSGGERDGGNLGRGGEGLQLLEVLLLLHQLVEQHLLLLLGGGEREGGEMEETRRKRREQEENAGERNWDKKKVSDKKGRIRVNKLGDLGHYPKENCRSMSLYVFNCV